MLHQLHHLQHLPKGDLFQHGLAIVSLLLAFGCGVLRRISGSGLSRLPRPPLPHRQPAKA